MARGLFAVLLGCALLFALNAPAPAQPVHLIKVAMDSYSYTPSVLTFNAGQHVVIELTNVDKQHPGRAHSFTSQYLGSVDYTVTGKAKQGVTKDGDKYVIVEDGDTAQISFVPSGRGQWTFYCSLYNHASLGQTGALVVWPAGYNPAAP